LQPFSARYFSSTDREWLTYTQEWAPAPLTVPSDVAPQVKPPQILSLQALQQLLRQPLDVYYRHRLQLRMLQPEDALDEHEPFELNKLQSYQLTLSLVELGQTDDLGLLQGQGVLPMAGFAALPWRRLQTQADALIQRAQARLHPAVTWQTLPTQAVDIQLENLGRVEGSLAGSGWYVNQAGEVLHLAFRPGAVCLSAGSAKLNALVGLWVSHIAACAQGLRVTSVLLGLDSEWQFAPMSMAQAQAHLMQLVGCYHQAWQAPMTLPGKSGAIWWAVYQHALSTPQAKALDTPSDALQAAHKAARQAFDSSAFSPAKGERAEHPMLRRHFANYDAVAPTIASLAETLYAPVLQAVQRPGCSA
jgi:exodeoxyribonuclease V gamma subunit